MFCPECKSEYRPGFTHCADCDVDLVEQLPPLTAKPPETDADDVSVIVFNTADPVEATVVQSLLEGNGIEVWAWDQNFTRLNPLETLVVGGVKLAVRKSQEALALEVLKEYRGRAGQDPTYGDLTAFSVEPHELKDENDAKEKRADNPRRTEGTMIELRDKDTGRPLGTISEDQLQFLIDQLEEESDTDTDYYLNSATLDMLESGGADPELLALLRQALGNREEMEVQWLRR